MIEGNRLGRYTLPEFDTWVVLYDIDDIPGEAGRKGLLKPQTKMSAKGAVPGTNTYKVGARTGATAGYISHCKSRVKLKQDSYMDAAFSDEYSRLEIQLQNTRIESRLGDEPAMILSQQ
jgi:hypothetical protein